MSRTVSTIPAALIAIVSMPILASCNGGGGGEGEKGPNPPAGVTAASTASGEVTVDWTPVTGATSYNIYWSTSSGVTKSTGTSIAGATPPHTQSALPSGMTYYFVVTTLVSSMESRESVEVSARPLDPPIGILVIGSTSQATIDWNLVSGASSYDLYWSTSPGVTKATGTLIAGVTPPRIHTGLTNATTYSYVVTAGNAVGGGAVSDISSEASTTPLDIPANVSASVASASEISIDWSAVVGATAYSIYWSTTPGVTSATGFPILGVTPPYLHGGLLQGTRYYYVVTATSGGGGGSESDDSAQHSAVADIIGLPDGAFGGSGFVVHTDAGGSMNDDTGFAVALDSTGRIHVAGSTVGTTTLRDMVIWRFNTDGSLDTTFNSQGWVTHHNAAGGNDDDDGFGMILDLAGNILVAGLSRAGTGPIDDDMVLWRFSPNGSLDTTLNSQGWLVRTDAGGGMGFDLGVDVVTDSFGRLLVAGASTNGMDSDMVVWRFSTDGSTDLSFNSQGWVVHKDAAGGNSQDEAAAIALDASEKILVVGTSFNASLDRDLAVWRFDTGGNLDTTFNNQGWFTHHDAAGGMGNDDGNAITVDGMGRILVAGSSWSGTSTDMVIWRLDSTGMLDTTFNSQGWVVHDNAAGGNGTDQGRGIVVDALGRIVVAGRSRGSLTADDMVIWRFNSSGTLDTTFNGQGWVMDNGAAGGNANDQGWSVTLDATGKIVVAGDSQNLSGDSDLVVWRYR